MSTSPTGTGKPSSGFGALPPVPVPIINRPLSNLAADTAAAKAMAQAAINVELFTIPLYMAAMTSLQGVHEINASGISYYEGRAWPGMSTSATATTPNQQAYNAIFAVFIEEMLHLQLAANIASALGVQPSFTSAALQTSNGGWTCYGASNTVIPHIVNLTDLVAPYNTLAVNLAALTVPQTQLFELIEQDHATALNNIQPAARTKYFPTAPFAGWTATMTEQDLPLFGTIGWMYYCYMQYITMVYTDGQTLFEKLFVAGSVQQDMFNSTSSSHYAEYPLMSATVSASQPLTALAQAVDMILGITSQGEGAGQSGASLARLLPPKARAALRSVKASQDDGGVDPLFQPDAQNLAFDYPSYNSDGSQAPQSADATARGSWGATTHFEVFTQLQSLVAAGGVVTFPAWFAAGNSWTAALLTTQPPNPSPPSNIPSTQQVADALNALGGEASLLNTVVTGAIAGVTMGLNLYWQSQSAGFPYPAMVGAGDRMTMCWAANSEPDLSQGLTPTPEPGRSPSACQGLNYQSPPANPSCGTVSVFHSCRGTNACSGQGGCGFAQPAGGSPQTCSAVAARRVRKPRMSARSGCGAPVGGTCGGPTPPPPGPTVYSAPGDNACQTLGGCAVPISASQLYPEAGTMQVYNLFGDAPQKIGTIPFALGDAVFDIAWEAYSQVMQTQGITPTKPTPSNLRVALPPST